MNKGKIINKKKSETCHIEGGLANIKGVIYVAECTEHNYTCTGKTGTTLNECLNRHRSYI